MPLHLPPTLDPRDEEATQLGVAQLQAYFDPVSAGFDEDVSALCVFDVLAWMAGKGYTK